MARQNNTENSTSESTRNNSQNTKSSVPILRLDVKYIKSRLGYDEKRIRQILGLARSGKFLDVVIAWNDYLESDSEGSRTCYEDAGGDCNEQQVANKQQDHSTEKPHRLPCNCTEECN